MVLFIMSASYVQRYRPMGVVDRLHELLFSMMYPTVWILTNIKLLVSGGRLSWQDTVDTWGRGAQIVSSFGKCSWDSRSQGAIFLLADS